MTEFTFAPGEKNIIGDRFSPSVIIFWLKTSIAASSTRVQYRAPNTLFGLIPLGADTKTIPLRNVASVDTSTKFNLGSLVWGVVFLLIGLGCLDSSVAVALVLILVAASKPCSSIRLRAATLSVPTASTPIMVTVSTAWTRLPFRNSPASMRG